MYPYFSNQNTMHFLLMKRPSQSLMSPMYANAVALLYFCLFLFHSEALVKLPENMTIPAVFAFGDSIADQGNNNNLSTLIKCNFSPYGKDLKGGVGSGRFSNSKTPPDLLAEELGIKDLLPAYLDPHLQPQDIPTGVSFASGGSGFDPQTPQLVSVLPLSKQLEFFSKYIGELKGIVGEEKTDFILANSIFIVVAGSDDIANTYFTIGTRRLQYDINSYGDLMVASASEFIQGLYKLGARRVAVFSLPPVGCVPYQRTLAGGSLRVCVESYNMAAKLVNAKLSYEIDNLKQKHPESRIVYVDVYSPFLDLIQHPLNYGFEVADRGCCGSGNVEVAFLCNKYSSTCSDDSKYLFWDSYHPTERGYRILVQQMLQTYLNNLL